jgi:hypothetical protein
MSDPEQRQSDAHSRQVSGTGGGDFIAMELTRLQLGFLVDLRTGACRAVAGMDAGVIGPLIRANLVRWDDDPAEAARRRRPPGSTFALTGLGAQSLAEHEARQRPMELPPSPCLRDTRGLALQNPVKSET